MARPQTFSKKENEKKKQARRLEKQNRKEERKLYGNTNSFEPSNHEQDPRQNDTV